MTIVNRIFRRSGETRALTRESMPDVMMGAPTILGPVSEREAMRLVDVFSCVRVLSEAASTLPLIAYRRTPADGRQRVTSGKLADLLTRPAPAVTQSSLIGQLVASLATRGNAYLGLYSGADGAVEQLGAIDSSRVTVQIVGGAPIYTLTHVDGRVTTHSTDDVIHIRLPITAADGILGMSPLAQAREALGLNRALGEEASALMANGSAVKGVLTVAAGPAQDDLMQNLKSGFEARHAGSKNAGRVAVVSGDVSFAAVSVSPHDAEFVEQRRLSTQEIARLFLPSAPWMVNAPSNDSMTYSNTESQALAFVKFTLAVYLVAIEQAVSNSPLCAGPNVFVEFLLDALLRADSMVRAQVYALALGNTSTGQPGWLARDEVRAREGLPPDNGPTEPVTDDG